MRATTSISESETDAVAANVSGSLLGHLWTSIVATLVLTILCCGIYPLLIWGIAQTVFPKEAGGSMVKKDGTYTTNEAEAVGSSLLGQNFSAVQYFHPRPSAAGAGYDASNSSGSNLGPLSDKLLNGLVTADDKGVKTLAFDGVRLRTLHYAMENGIAFTPSTPLDKFKDKDGNLDDIKLVEAFAHAGDPADKRPLEFSGFCMLIPADAVTASASGLDPHISPANAKLQIARVAKARNMSGDAVQKLIDQNTTGPDLGVLGDPGVNVLMLNLALDAAHPSTTTQPSTK